MVYSAVLLVWGTIAGLAVVRAWRSRGRRGSRLIFSTLALMALAPAGGAVAHLITAIMDAPAAMEAARLLGSGLWQPVVYLVCGLLVLGAFWREMQDVLHRHESLETILAQQEAVLARVTDSAFEGIYLVDPKSLRYVDVNPAGSRALGYDRQEMIGMSLDVIHPGENFRELKEFILAAVHQRQHLCTTAIRRDGRTLQSELVANAVEYNGRPYVLVVGRDVTRKLRAREQIRRLNRVYRLLSSVNRAVTREDDADVLMSRVCRIAVDEGEFMAAWAGRLLHGRVKPEHMAGQALDYIHQVTIDMDDPQTGSGPVAAALRTGQVVVVNSVARDERFRAWRKGALAAGVRSVAAIPVRGPETVWVVTLYSGQEHGFDREMEGLLTNLGEDLGFALHHMALEQENRRARQELEKLSQAVEQSADAVMILGTDGLIQWVNARFEQLTGYTQDEVCGRLPTFLCANEQEARKYRAMLSDLRQGRGWKGEFRYCKKDGQHYWSMDTITPIRGDDGQVSHFVSSSEDYTDLRKAQELIEELAFYDPLTGLPNRRLLHDRMRQSLETARQDGHSVAVLFLDLDKFKHINDTMGHTIGDELLKVMANRLASVVGKADTVARLGGDEFTVVISKVLDLSEVVLIAEEILEQVHRPLQLGGYQIQISTSVGITLYPDDSEDINELLRNADLAMYHAKGEGRGNFQFYTEEINARALSQVEMERQLRKALADKSFRLYYQPKVDLQTGEVTGIEALIRWIGEEGRPISPAVFIPLAEETGLIEDIGRWVLRQATEDLALLVKALGRPISMAINLSAKQFRHAQSLRLILGDLLMAHGLQPEWIELELTESMLVDDIEDTIRQLHELRRMGFSLAIDDFGTGYSSLNYLHRFPIDTLKIDRSFVQRLDDEESGRSIVAAIVAMARELGMKVVAEGVETERQLALLRNYEVDAYQGFLHSRPMPLSELLVKVNSPVRVLPHRQG
ncbi:MAG: EAL domain-containing protein [Gammaproteobacteria bacterium]|nr:MAG: EAL domain-containing protein [Gammaproteobacteria bacterium]